MLVNFQDFISNIIIESLHPDLKTVITSSMGNRSKQNLLSKKIKELTTRGENTGIEGNMPKGSSRAYLKHSEPHGIVVDGTPTTMKTGTKVAIRATLDAHHNLAEHDGMGLGQLQNHAENGDHWVNNSYRTLTHTGGNTFETNHDRGIFPPLVDHDDANHHWSHVGHVDNISLSQFRELTKTKEFPKGISHGEFMTAMKRFHERNNGKYWGMNSMNEEKKIDHIDTHPLVQNFQDYHGNSGNPPYDLGQIKNMGVWTHPVTGTKHIVARDHGYSGEVELAYQNARKKAYARNYKPWNP